jgi:hypothetical protein
LLLILLIASAQALKESRQLFPVGLLTFSDHGGDDHLLGIVLRESEFDERFPYNRRASCSVRIHEAMVRNAKDPGRERPTFRLIGADLHPHLKEDLLGQISCILIVAQMRAEIPIDARMIAFIENLKREQILSTWVCSVG